jgi:queuosine precursor transporter
MISIRFAYIAMIVIVASCNYLVQFPINDWLTYGAFAYPLSFLVTEITNNFYGPKIARKVVYIGFFLAVILSVWLATPKIAMASGTAFLVSQLLDISIFNNLRRTSWWFAPFFASLIASFVDTALFFSLAFWGEDLPFITWAIGDFGVKLLCDIVMLLPFRLAIRKAPQSA